MIQHGKADLTERTIEDFLIEFYVRQFQGVWGTRTGFRTTVDTDTILVEAGDGERHIPPDQVFFREYRVSFPITKVWAW